jgi:hypothetical protein
MDCKEKRDVAMLLLNKMSDKQTFTVCPIKYVQEENFCVTNSGSG